MQQQIPLNTRHPFQRLSSHDAETYPSHTSRNADLWQASNYPTYKQNHSSIESQPLTGNLRWNAPAQLPENDKLHRLKNRFRCDCAALTLCIVIWILMAGSIASFVGFYNLWRRPDGFMGTDALWATMLYGIGLYTLAAVVNEALIDRTWRRVKAQTLRGGINGDYLRAANFQLMDCIKRLFRGRLTRREFSTLVSYALLRWGTSFSFSSIQLVVKIVRNSPTQFAVRYRYAYLPVPLALHLVGVFGSLAVSGLPPWSLFFNRYDKKVIYAAYQRYLDVVPFGSAATSEQVADILDAQGLQPHDFSSLAIKHAPGLQLRKKLRGILSGLVILIVVPTAMYAYQHTADADGFPVARFTYSTGLTILYTGYSFAKMYAVWTLGLEGITATPRSDTNWLGTTSGIMLLVKAFRQRRPVKVFFLYWIFWSHAFLFRILAWLMVLVLSMHKIVPEQDSTTGFSDFKTLANIFWPAGLWLWVFLPFSLWLFVPFKAPLAPMDQWRISKILEGATKGKGRYGIEGPPGQGRAAWGPNTRVFTKEILL
jgi:hypothetical protein